jgi:hypothetical protein
MTTSMVCQYVLNEDDQDWVPPKYCRQPATRIVQYEEHAGYFITGEGPKEASDIFTFAVCDEHRDWVENTSDNPDSGQKAYTELELKA